MKKYIIGLIVVLLYGTGVFAQCPAGSTTLSGNGTVTINAGQSYCVPNGEVYNGNLILNGGTLTNNGTINLASLTNINCVLINNGVLSTTGNMVIQASATIINNNSINVGASFNNSGSITNTGTINSKTASNNQGKLQNSGTIEFSGDLSNNSGGTINNNGEFKLNGNFYNNDSLINSANIFIDGNFINNSGKFLNKKETIILGSFTNNGNFINEGDITSSNVKEEQDKNAFNAGNNEFELALQEGDYYDEKGRIPMMIKFKELSVFEKKYYNITNTFDYTAQFNNFINRLKSYLSILGYDESAVEIGRSFSLITNKIAIVAPRQIYEKLLTFPDVESVSINANFQLSLSESLPLINAATVQNSGNKGAGVKVGVLDSGIDYNHPALQSSNGSTPLDEVNQKFLLNQNGCKVCGGYDFGDNDYNPMDKNSHGTHVSGIIAGNGGEIVGVAPEARLYALKVCKDIDPKTGLSSGSGSIEAIIAAFEWALDPKGDGIDLNDDMLNIINMSMSDDSGNGLPIEFADVVNNVINAGIVVCVATGNSGKYYNVGTPANIDNVFSVGASNKYGFMYAGSNKGPAIYNSDGMNNFIMKPDVVAPGESIYSSVLNNGYASYTGTSMATPMVAGACALVKNAHQNWSNVDIKSALMATSDLLTNQDIMTQGSGEINVGNAINYKTMLYRVNDDNEKMGIGPVLNFGKAFLLSQPNWQSQKLKICIKNVSSESRIFTINNATLPAGVELYIGTKKLSTENYITSSISAGSEIILEAYLTIDASAFVNTTNKFIGGYLSVSNNVDPTENVHFCWNAVTDNENYTFNLTLNNINSEIPVNKPTIRFLNNNLEFPDENCQILWKTNTTADVIINEGTYDVYVVFQDLDANKLLVFLEDEVTLDKNNPNISVDLDVQKVPVVLKKQNGTDFTDPRMVFVLTRSNWTLGTSIGISSIGIIKQELYLNTVQTTKYNYVLSYFDKIIDDSDNGIYMVNFPTFKSFNSNLDFSINYMSQDIDVEYLKPYSETNVVAYFNIYKQWNCGRFYTKEPSYESILSSGTKDHIKVYFTGRQYVTGVNNENHNMFLKYGLKNTSDKKILESAYFIPTTNKFGFAEQAFSGNIFFQEPNTTSYLGPFFGFPVTSVVSQILNVSFNGQSFEKRWYDNNYVSYTITDAETSQSLASGNLTNDAIDLSSFYGKKILVQATNNNFSKDGKDMSGVLDINLDLINTADNYPPQIAEFKIVNNQDLTHSVSTCNSYIYFTTFERDNYRYYSSANARMFIKSTNSENWDEASLNIEEGANSRYFFRFSDIPLPGNYDIKIEVEDPAGNKTVWTINNVINVPADITEYTAKNQNSNKTYCSIQGAIDDAGTGDVILISDGVYGENLVIDKAITLKALNKGNVTLDPFFKRNSAFICSNTQGGDIVLDGLVLNGYSSETNYIDATNSQSIKILNCTFNNFILNSNHPLIENLSGGFSLLFENCTMDASTASNFVVLSGAGSTLTVNNFVISNSTIYNEFFLLSNISDISINGLHIESCEFSSIINVYNDIASDQNFQVENISTNNNTLRSGFKGCLLKVYNTNTINIDNIEWFGNFNSTQVIGIENCNNLTLSNIEIDANNFAQNFDIKNCSTCFISGSRFLNNNATSYLSSNFISNYLNLTISKSFFLNNYISFTGSGLNSESVLNIENSVISENYNTPFICWNSKLEIKNSNLINCPFIPNFGNNVKITNSIFWSPSAPICSKYNNSSITFDVKNSILLNYYVNNVRQNDANPLFVNIDNNDFHLQSQSPCVGAALPGIVNDDIEGNSRPIPSGSIPDIGAYESEFGNQLSWDDILSSESNSYSTTNGGTIFINQVGPENTDEIREEIATNTQDYIGMSEQESTIAAAEKLYGNGCTFAISAQNAWYVLGLSDEYVINQNYTLTNPANNVQGAQKMYHASENIIASNVISSGANVELKAENTITLVGGFESTGSYTHAFIVQCNEYEVKSGEGFVEEEVSQKQDSTIQNPIGEVLISINPNPTSGEFVVTSNYNLDYLKIATSTGAALQQYRNLGTEQTCSVNDLSAGVYIVTISSGNKTIIEKLIVVK